VLYAEGTSGAEALTAVPAFNSPHDQPTVLASGEAPLGKPVLLSAHDIARLLQPSASLSPSHSALIVNFLSGGDGRPPGTGSTLRVVLNEARAKHPVLGRCHETMEFELDYTSRCWKRIFTRRPVPEPWSACPAKKRRMTSAPPAVLASSSAAH
jgi:hypothetical protein